MLCGWIALFVGPGYYFISSRTSMSVDDAASGESIGSVEDAIRAMEAWNVDLTWFVFMRHRLRADVVTTDNARKCGATNLSFNGDGEPVRLAELVF
jgi:hypothetical protein